MNQGADPNTPDVQGDTPTHRAFATDKLDVKKQKNCELIFHYLSFLFNLIKNQQIIRVIVNSGGDLNSVNTKGQTPLALCSANTL